jgi:uncharacterized membrane protein
MAIGQSTSNNNAGPTAVLVDLEGSEPVELATLRKQTLGIGIVSLLSALTSWTPYFTPWIGAALTIPTCYVAYTRMQTAASLLQGKSCFCMPCGPNPRNTLKACRPMLIACTVVAVIAIITQIAALAAHGDSGSMSDAVGVASIICLILLLVLAIALGYVAYHFKKAVIIYENVSTRQHLKEQERSGGLVSNVMSTFSNFMGGGGGGHHAQPPAAAVQGQPQSQPPRPGTGGANYQV